MINGLSQPARFLIAATIATILCACITPFQRDLFVGDETKYGQVVREMRSTGHVFLPTLGGVPFTHKPPLHFWMIDALTIPLGVYSTWAFVLPSLLAFLFLLWLMWKMGGPMAAFICATSLMVWGSAQSARMDVAFTAFIVLGVWAMQRDRIVAAGAALGIATLIKGPMAPVIGIVLYALESWRCKRPPRLRDLGALALMAVIPLLWFVPAMMMGGSAYTHEVIVKQTVGRAISAWVHNAPPWFYLLHVPGSIFPWFFAAVAAVRGANRLYTNWILAVIVPYSLMSSKLDVYMMAMIPPVALMIADHLSPIANRIALAVMIVLPVAGYRFAPPESRPVLIALGVAAILGLLTWRSSVGSTIAVGLVPIVALVFAAVTMMPFINNVGSTRNLIAAIEKQHVAPESVALYTCPYLWTRDFPPELERVRYVDTNAIGNAELIATSRSHANEIAATLRGYRHVDQFQMIGKWFDVYRR